VGLLTVGTSWIVVERRSAMESESTQDEPRYRKVRRPTIFMFQPDQIEKIEPHETGKLREWEAMMKTRVGLKANVTDLSGLPTISLSGGVPVD
jgi:hypothetical protein